VEIVPGSPPENIEIGHDGGLLLGLLDAETIRSRGAVVVAPGAGGGVGRDDGFLGMGVGMRQTTKRVGVGQDLSLLVGLLPAESGRGRGTVVVASVAVAPGGRDGLFGVEEGIGHETKALGIGEDLAHHLFITFHIFLFFRLVRVLGSGIVDVNIDPVLGYRGFGAVIAHDADEYAL